MSVGFLHQKRVRPMFLSVFFTLSKGEKGFSGGKRGVTRGLQSQNVILGLFSGFAWVPKRSVFPA